MEVSVQENGNRAMFSFSEDRFDVFVLHSHSLFLFHHYTSDFCPVNTVQMFFLEDRTITANTVENPSHTVQIDTNTQRLDE